MYMKEQGKIYSKHLLIQISNNLSFRIKQYHYQNRNKVLFQMMKKKTIFAFKYDVCSKINFWFLFLLQIVFVFMAKSIR